ncbi:hypothetical protein PV797_16190 [Clostridiaceae bacterium M8S5]|nr:hypothetical protein PV797_16190 [Clostridiaceae bacterium M8S5]
MGDEILLSRHKSKYDKYYDMIINQEDIIKIIPSMDKIKEEIKRNKPDITTLLLQRKIFALTLEIKGNVVGFFCLDNIDWENNNCQIKGSLLENEIHIVKDAYLMKAIEDIVDFAHGCLGLKRVYGVSTESSYNSSIVNEIFCNEGKALDKETLYYGHVVDYIN